MADWVRTAKTIYCDAVADEVTLIGEKDATITCTGYKKYYDPDKDTARLIRRKSAAMKKQLICEGPECRRVTAYRDKLLAEKA